MSRIADVRAQLETLWHQQRTIAEELASMEARWGELQAVRRIEQADALALQTMPMRAKRLQTALREVERTIIGTKEQLKLLTAQKVETERALSEFEAKWGPLFLIAAPLGVAVGSVRDILAGFADGSLPPEVLGAAIVLAGFLETLKRKERDLAAMRGQLADLGA